MLLLTVLMIALMPSWQLNYLSHFMCVFYKADRWKGVVVVVSLLPHCYANGYYTLFKGSDQDVSKMRGSEIK